MMSYDVSFDVIKNVFMIRLGGTVTSATCWSSRTAASRCIRATARRTA